MGASNLIFYSEPNDKWHCSPCQRYFVSEQAIHAHCRHAEVHSGEWCERCERLFVSQTARRDHDRNSSRHNVCPNCEADFDSLTDLNDHLEEEHFYCRRCKGYVKDRWGRKSRALWRTHQVEEHFMCTECGTYFENQNNVDQHQQVHLPRDRKCYGCSQKFSRLSGMMIHLESGACPSEVTLGNIDSWALQYRQFNYYINSQAQNSYSCPGCENKFRYLSGLLQHLESNACGRTVNNTLHGLQSFLARNVSQYA